LNRELQVDNLPRKSSEADELEREFLKRRE
jgi:hypothetical protein